LVLLRLKDVAVGVKDAKVDDDFLDFLRESWPEVDVVSTPGKRRKQLRYMIGVTIKMLQMLAI
jgi:hypothetical protein